MSVEKRTTSSPYHPQGNGLLENFNRTIKNMLRRVTAERPKDWSRYLVPLMFVVRDTPQDSIGFSPFALLYGRTVRTPMMLLRELWIGEVEEAETKTTYEYVLDLQERIESTCASAMEELSKVQTRNQKYYNRKTHNRPMLETVSCCCCPHNITSCCCHGRVHTKLCRRSAMLIITLRCRTDVQKRSTSTY